MKYLFAAACALAVMGGSSIHPAHAKNGGSFKSAMTKAAPDVIQRDHRIPYVGRGGGVKVFSACKRGESCDKRHQPHNH
jgi:hypothetical protein